MKEPSEFYEAMYYWCLGYFDAIKARPTPTNNYNDCKRRILSYKVKAIVVRDRELNNRFIGEQHAKTSNSIT